MNTSTIPSVMAPLAFVSDPDTDDLIFGDRLASGMVVLIESTVARANPDRLNNSNSYELNRILESAQWCRVEELRYHSGDLVSFIGVYHDGSKRLRMYNVSFAWYVKKNSMPAE